MLFSEFSTYLEKIEHTSSRLEITALLANIFTQASGKELNIISNLGLGQLHPPYIKKQLNIAEKTVIKAVALLLEKTEQEISLLSKKKGDLGLLISEFEWKSDTKISITELYDQLCLLESVSGVGSQEEKITILKTILQNSDPLSAKYIIRIVLAKLRLGFSDMTIIDALSWMEVKNKSLRKDIEHAYNISVDIGLIAQELKEKGIEYLKNKNIEMGIPIRPAAAERLPSAQAIFEKLGNCVAQPKIDGLRLQIHLQNDKNKVAIFSRNLTDMSDMFPELSQALLQLPVENMIAEGEAIGFDPNTQDFLPFQETIKRKRKHGIENASQEFPLKLFLFDLLYLNNNNLMKKTHEERRRILLSIIPSFKIEQTINVIEEKNISSANQLENYFEEMIEKGLEGIVTKRSDALYQPGKRNFNWIKLKRQEEGQLEDTIDCVILGYYSGKGKRTQFGIGAFLVGVYNKKEDCFETIARIGTGLSDEDWKELKSKCDLISVISQPHNVNCAKTLAPDVWVSPEIVCIVRADEITLSPIHTAHKTEFSNGYALRFPRIMGYRTDKNCYDITTTNEIKRLYEDQYM